MSRRLNDGEAYEILNGRVIRPGHGPKASLAALQWAADRAGQSYGSFTLNLTPADEEQIQAEFDTYKRQLNAQAAARRAARVENELPAPHGFIISDNDV